MTPERARELARDALTGFAWSLDGTNPLVPVADAILAACLEERRAALTEAAELIEPTGAGPTVGSYDGGKMIARRQCVDAIRQLRDREPR